MAKAKTQKTDRVARPKVRRLAKRVSLAVEPADFRRAADVAAVVGWPVSEVWRRALKAGLPAVARQARQAAAEARESDS